MFFFVYAIHKCVTFHRCFHGFTNIERLKCVRFKPQGVKFPEDDMLYFKAYRKMVQVPVYIVAGILILFFNIP